jgi:hypothetical protein
MSGNPVSIPLVVGANTRIGTVTVTHDASNIFIAYRLDNAPGMLLHDLRAHVAVSYDQNGIDDGIPHSYHVGLIHGRFAQQFAAPGVLVHTLTIPITQSFREAGVIWIAACALVGDSLRPKSVVAFEQGPKKNGRPVAADRTDPNKALNPDCPATWKPGDPVTFVSLGADGHVIVDFGEMLDAAQYPRITCWEISMPPGPVVEKASVQVSVEPHGPWTQLSPEASNGRPNSLELITATSIPVTGVPRYRYVRVTDTSGIVVNPSLPEPSYEDGFDLDGVAVASPGREVAWAASGQQPLDVAVGGQPFAYDLGK